MTHADLISHYGLSEKKLYMLYHSIMDFLVEKGIRISFTSLESVIEADVYERADETENRHHESCLSDGMELYQHNDMEEIGGICSRLYDILHMGCGHIWQWNAGEESLLQFYGDNAWTVGATYYLGAPAEKLKEVWNYEEEAGALAFANLKQVLWQYNFDADFTKRITMFLNDYLKTDLEYITSFYRTGEVKNFFDKWQFDAAPVREISPDFKLHMQRRTNKCIALINVR